jgi:hypothetical protein
MLEVTKAGQAATAEQIAHQRGIKASVRYDGGTPSGSMPKDDDGVMPAEDQSREAATSGMDAARDMREERDGHSMPDGGREALRKAIPPDPAEMAKPGPISPQQYQRGRLTEGRAAYSHQAGRPHRLGGMKVSGSGPVADSLIAHGGGRVAGD